MKEHQTSQTTAHQDRKSNTNLNQCHPGATSASALSVSRRLFLKGVGGATAAVGAGVFGRSSLLDAEEVKAQQDTGSELRDCPPGCDRGPQSPVQRANTARTIRIDAANRQRNRPIPDHPCNRDEERYRSRNYFASYSKGLPHDGLGEVDPAAYCALLNALTSGRHDNLEAVPLGCPDETRQRKLINPQAGLAFDLQGSDSHHLAIPPAPAFDSAEQAGEIAELYWMALARDVPFAEYNTNSITQTAAADLSTFSDFRGPRVDGQVTTDTLFRGFTAGDLAGPYISQFLYKCIPFGSQYVEQRMRTLQPGVDYMTRYSDWLAVQNGCLPEQSDRMDTVRRYIRNGRDLAQWVHKDVLFQAYFNAGLILLTPPDETGLDCGGIGAPLNPGNPYVRSQTQEGFGTFGPPYIIALAAEVATRALKAVWYQKWFVHRRLRPEVYGGRIHNLLRGAVEEDRYPIHEDLFGSSVTERVFNRYGAYLLPQAYPEGSPLHPSYGAGHATVAGACVTILKALFDESFVISDPVVPDRDGLSLVPYTGPGADRFTVRGELNKLAANIAMGRNFAGIHWRSDYAESLRLGEAIAIQVLTDQRLIYNEAFGGFTFTTFDGIEITV